MKKRRNKSSPAGGGVGGDSIPLIQNNDLQKNDDHPGPKHKQPVLSNRGKKTMVLALSVLVLIGVSGALFFGQSTAQSDMSRYGPRTNATNAFVTRFEDVLLNDLGHDFFVPLIFENGQLLCRRKHKQQLSRQRGRFFAQMVRHGIRLRKNNRPSSSIDDVDGGLPVLVMDVDGNGCNIRHRRDDYGFPRLAWSALSSKHNGWMCNAISMPSYETWKFYHRSHGLGEQWERTFEQNEKQYPWSQKINRAVWRGSTTYEGSQYHESELGQTPRGELVKKSMEHPDLIDAGFHKINQKFQSQRHELADQFTVVTRMSPREMMNYKAIIDIDGNNWSSRFGMLLCSNSVVIKIDPDFIEYFYEDGGDVKPMVHYIPASLDNITEVVAHVTDKKNEDQMKTIVKSANSWCQKALSEEGLAKGSILQLETYKSALDSYNDGDNSWHDEWRQLIQRFSETIDDLVDCNAWSIIDYFTFPIFAGL